MLYWHPLNEITYLMRNNYVLPFHMVKI